MHTILNTYIGENDIILVTEPWFGSIGNGMRGPAAHPHWQPVLPKQDIPVHARPRVMCYYAKRDDFNVVLRSDILEDLDAQVVEVCQRPHSAVLLVVVYNETELEGGDRQRWTLDRLWNVQFQPDVPTVFAGDWNAHHRMWQTNREN
ncbi:hypothetical protein C8Q80DRAFT_1091141, partial [Daedaleopsis nitida]